MRRVLFLVLLLSLSVAQAQTMITGQVSKEREIQYARKLTFDTFPSRKTLKAYARLDQEMMTHLMARTRKQSCLPDRVIGFFDDNSYGVGKFGTFEHLYFRPDGRLYAIEYRTKPVGVSYTNDKSAYPVITAIYSYPDGVLIRARYAPSKNEDYGFSRGGSSDGYCIGNTCYKPDGTYATTRSQAAQCIEQYNAWQATNP